MAGRRLLRSPAAIVFATLGGLAVAPLIIVGWFVAVLYGSTGLATDPAFLGGFGRVGYLVIATVVLGLAAVVWLPFAAGVAFAVGRESRGRPVTIGATASAVLDDVEPLARWMKTRVAIGPLADPLLSEDDVHPSEIAIGCAGFVVPALVLDARVLSTAVERANRVPPEATRTATMFVPLALAILTGIGVLAWHATADGPSLEATLAVVVGVALVGGVATAALDAAWRASVYAAADTSDGFRE